MTAPDHGEALWRAAGLIALAAGAGFGLAPGPVGRLFGMPGGGMTGTAAMGWRLFAVRTAVVGGAALTGSGAARRAVLPVQLLDQAVFVHALATRSVPRRAALTAMATSGLLITLAAAAARRTRPLAAADVSCAPVRGAGPA